QSGGGDEGQRPRHRTGGGRGGRRRALSGSAFETTGMKREYTDEHACAGVDAELPEIVTWPNRDANYENEIVMPEFDRVCTKSATVCGRAIPNPAAAMRRSRWQI